jgi:ArsR family metal-binding transcriptional regulator
VKNTVKFLEKVEIVQFLPCVYSGFIRFHASVSNDVSPVFPYLNRLLKSAIYNPNAQTLTIKKEGSLITLFSNQITAGKVPDARKAHEIIEWLADMINDTYGRRGEIEPLTERRAELSAIDVYKLLPGGNCRKCGELTCMAFAVKVVGQQAGVVKCSELFNGSRKEKRNYLLKLLRDTGYAVPEVFNDA